MKVLKYTGLFVYSIWAYFWFMLLAIVSVFVFIFILIFVRKDPGRYLYAWCHWYDVVWSFLCFTRYEVTGREYYDPGRAYVITSNHKTVGDMFLMVEALHHVRYRPLSKVELKDIPVLGFLFSKTLLFVDRSDPESRKKSIALMEEQITRENMSILIFPEGTRNRTTAPLKDFYDGAFRVAIECQVPVMPMVMLDTDVITPQSTWLIYPGKKLTCHFLPPIETVGMTTEQLPALKEEVYRQMERVVIDHWKKTRGYQEPLGKVK